MFRTPEAYQNALERLWKSYGSKENWEEFKTMRTQIAQQEKQITELSEQVRVLLEDNKVLVLECSRISKDKVV